MRPLARLFVYTGKSAAVWPGHVDEVGACRLHADTDRVLAAGQQQGQRHDQPGEKSCGRGSRLMGGRRRHVRTPGGYPARNRDGRVVTFLPVLRLYIG
jgi:hypothetical protein